MCGLVGFATTKAEQVISADLTVFIFNQMMEMNDARGGDSFGFSLIRPAKKSIEHFKVIGKCGSQQDDKRLQKGLEATIKALADGGPVIVMGHNRKATTGDITIRNQHPFEFGKPKKESWVLGAHNGMIWGYDEAIDLWDIKRKVEVDSEVIFRGLMTDNDPVDILGTLIPVGSLALTYMRNNWECLNMFAGDNPINVGYLPGLMFWSSEYLHLKSGLFGLVAQTSTLKSDTLYSISVDTHETTNMESVRPINTLLQRSYSTAQNFHNYRPHIAKVYGTCDDNRSFGMPFGSTKRQASSTPSKAVVQVTQPNVIPIKTPTHKTADVGEEMIFYDDLDRPTVPKTKDTVDIGLATCAVCELKGATDGDIQLVQPHSLLWYEGDSLCGTCYQWMIMSPLEGA